MCVDRSGHTIIRHLSRTSKNHDKCKCNKYKKIDLNGHRIDMKKVRLEKFIRRGPDRFLHPGLYSHQLTILI